MTSNGADDRGHPSATLTNDPTGAGLGASAPGAGADCRTCDLRPRCIRYGWVSPGGIWFENAVILAPKPGCRGFVGHGAAIRARFDGRCDH